MLPVDFLPGARRDFDESFNWYAEKSAQAAIRFMNAIDAALTVIAAIPQRFVKLDDIISGVPCTTVSFSHHLSGRRRTRHSCSYCSRKTASRLLETAEMSLIIV